MAATEQAPTEHRVLREACGLIDRSERGKLALSGPDAAEFLTGQVTNDVVGLAPGHGCYAALLTPKGKMLADLRVIRPEPPTPIGLWLDTERVALQALFDNLRRHLVGYRVELHKRTLEQGLLSLIGPRAATVAQADLAELEHANRPSSVAGRAVMLIRTDVGVDVVCDAPDLPIVSTALTDGGATPVSEAAAECLRVARGRPRYGLELDDSTIPQEAGLNDRAVSFSKGCYVGQETVARLYYRGKPNRHLRGLTLSGPARRGEELGLNGRSMGRLGSVASSPELGFIALAMVRREAHPGDLLDVGSEGVRGQVVELPFPTPTH